MILILIALCLHHYIILAKLAKFHIHKSITENLYLKFSGVQTIQHSTNKKSLKTLNMYKLYNFYNNKKVGIVCIQGCHTMMWRSIKSEAPSSGESNTDGRVISLFSCIWAGSALVKYFHTQWPVEMALADIYLESVDLMSSSAWLFYIQGIWGNCFRTSACCKHIFCMMLL